MKRRSFLILACLALLLPLLFVSVCAVALPPKYDATYMGELKYKFERLTSVKGPRIVFIGGSSAAFGVDSSLIEEELSEYEVVNFGMYAALGSRVMLDLAKDCISQGDIVIFMPELNEQTLSDFTDGTYALQGLDGAWQMLAQINPDLYPSIFGAVPAFAMEKLHYQLHNELPEPGPLYRRSSFNEYGDIESDIVSINIMPEEYDPDLPVSMNEDLPTEEFTAYLNDYARSLKDKGASFYYHFCPVNEKAIAGSVNSNAAGHINSISEDYGASGEHFYAEEAVERYYKHLKDIIDFPIMGDPREAVMEPGWFYDTNFHLNQAGRTAFTYRLIRDLKVCLGNTSPTEIQVPEMPRTLAFLQMPDDVDTVLRRGTYAGNTVITEITIPETIRRIEDGAFDGCTSLRAIHLKSKDPTGILVGRDLLSGTDATLYVPEEALSAYRTDYRFSLYADRIEKEPSGKSR